MPEGEISLHESSVLLIPQGEQQNQTPLFTSINKFKSLSMWSNNFLKKSWTHEENVGVSDSKSEFGWVKFSKIKSVHIKSTVSCLRHHMINVSQKTGSQILAGECGVQNQGLQVPLEQPHVLKQKLIWLLFLLQDCLKPNIIWAHNNRK